MLALYIFALLIHTAFSSLPCLDKVEIVSIETKNVEDVIGNWTYVYHWDASINFTDDIYDIDFSKDCHVIQIDAATPEFIEAKRAECKNLKAPFEWSDVKLRINSPMMWIKDGVIAINEKENWLMADCQMNVQLKFKKVSDDYIVMVNPLMNHATELLARQIPMVEELRCIAHNLDVGRNMKGLGVCYKHKKLYI